jgi:hypothetical protein
MPESAALTEHDVERVMPPTWMKSFITSKPGLRYMRMLVAMGVAE